MAKFEAFLRPEGAGSEDTLAGRTSLDAFDHNISATADASPPPAGEESAAPQAGTFAAVSRIIIIEDADYLGHARQSYLRRMMEESSRSARFLFTTHTPSRIIEALRSRTQHVRMPSLTRLQIEQRLEHHRQRGRPATGTRRVGRHRPRGQWKSAQSGVHASTSCCNATSSTTERTSNCSWPIRVAGKFSWSLRKLRGRVHEWKWERQGEKNTRVLKGAMGAMDQMMANHDLDGRGVVDRLHHFLVAGRTHYPEPLLADLLSAVSACDMNLQRSAQQRIQLEELLHRFAEVGRRSPPRCFNASVLKGRTSAMVGRVAQLDNASAS